jgi:hypothetical protein
MNFKYNMGEKSDGIPKLIIKSDIAQKSGIISRGAKKIGRAVLFASALAVGGAYGSEQQALAMEKLLVTDTKRNINPEREAFYLVKYLDDIHANPNDHLSVEIAERKARTLITNFAAQLERRRLNVSSGTSVHLDKDSMRTALQMIVEALNITSDKELGNEDGNIDESEKTKLLKKISGKIGFDVFKQMVRENKIGK